MPRVTVHRKAHFNAAHRLHNPNWSDERNLEVFGKCNNQYYHGHNYELIVSLTGEIDPETGYVYDLGKLKSLIKTEIEDTFDHKNINIEVEEFKTLPVSTEYMAVVIYDKLRKRIEEKFKLKITLYETPRNFVTYEGE
ncbi:6-pyruvoyl trahydropterin synthase family protein [Tenacibaculum sp. C7A-26P2]|uniref:6-pyruvoyl trahydropterin synthase family protein n=1 Tax=Tenacibaculum sp. C7A-26P2 TaxID=3447504 RepID=UPI003F86A2D7